MNLNSHGGGGGGGGQSPPRRPHRRTPLPPGARGDPPGSRPGARAQGGAPRGWDPAGRGGQKVFGWKGKKPKGPRGQAGPMLGKFADTPRKLSY